MQSFQTFGLSQNDVIPQLIRSKLTSAGDDTEVFLHVFFETNPEDEKFDQRLHVKLQPLKVIYDAQTVIRILEVFTPEKDISTVKNTLVNFHVFFYRFRSLIMVSSTWKIVIFYV